MGTGPKIGKNAFADLLGDFKPEVADKSEAPKTMAEMRRAKLAQTTDPDVLKVCVCAILHQGVFTMIIRI